MKRKNIVGENLRRIRLERGLTQEEVALRSGLSQGYINQLENGKRLYTQKSLELIAKGLNVPVIDFFKKEERESGEGVREEIPEYKKKPYSPKEVLSLLNELPPRIREHYVTLLRLERDLWKR